MYLDGIGLLVRSSEYTAGFPRLKYDSTGICALVRTTLFTDGTSAAEHGKCYPWWPYQISICCNRPKHAHVYRRWLYSICRLGHVSPSLSVLIFSCLATFSANHWKSFCSLEINVGIIAASIPTLKPLFNPSRPSIFRYFKHRKTSGKHHKTSGNIPANDIDDGIRLNKLTLITMPSAMPSSLSYYQGKVGSHGKGWENLESHINLSSPEKAHVGEKDRVLEMESKMESGNGDGVYAIGESMV